MVGRWLRLLRAWGDNGTFYGGVFLPAEKERTEERPSEPLPISKRLHVPMVQHCGPPAEPCVQVGQVVRCGELIGRASGPDGAAVHSSADGVVRAITVCDTPHAPEVPCVEIETERAAIPHVASASAISNIEELVAHVSAAGIVEYDSLGHGGMPTATRLRDAAARECEYLIINALESDPCVTADWRILVERTNDVLAGAKRLGSLLRVREVWLAVDAMKGKMASHLAARCERLAHEHGSSAVHTGKSKEGVSWPVRVSARPSAPRPESASPRGKTAEPQVQIAPLINKYPQGHAALLVSAVCGREIPDGKDDLAVGAAVISVGTVAAIESSLRSGMPVTQRLVTVTGDAAERPGNYMIALGTPISHVIEHVGLRRPPWAVVVGSPMTGVAIRRLETVVTKRTTAILLLGDEGGGRAWRGPAMLPGACTRCGWCLEDCPVGLDPAGLLNAIERRDLGRAAALHVQACIGCGLCSYACPARLPIAQSIRAAQKEVRGRGPEAPEVVGDASRTDATEKSGTLARADNPPTASERSRLQTPGIPGARAPTTTHPASRGMSTEVAPTEEGSRLQTAPTEDGARARTAPTEEEARLQAAPTKGGARLGARTGVSARLLRVEPGPHWHGVETTASATWTWIAAASLPAIAGTMLFGSAALGAFAISIATALLAEKVVSAIISRPASAGANGSGEAQALLTGLLVALTLPPQSLAVGWYVPVTAALVATLIGQTLLGGHGNHLWHPAALARVAVALLFGSQFMQVLGASQAATAAGTPFTRVGALVALATGDPRFAEAGRSAITVAIRDYLPPWGMTLFGAGEAGPAGAIIGGPDIPIGGHVVMLIVAALILGWRGHVRGWCIVSALTTAALAAFVLPIQQGGRLIWFPGLTFDDGLPVGLAYVVQHLTAGGLMLVILLLAGDSVTSPLTSRGQRWFGAGVGALAIALRLYGLAGTAPYWALLAMNTLAPLIDRRTKRKVYGT